MVSGQPAGAMRDHLLCGLVDLVEVRPFFAVHFDVDEKLIHQCGSLRILERFVCHHMTPMAG